MKLKLTTALAASAFLAACQNSPQYTEDQKMVEAKAIPGSPADFKQNVPDSAYFAFDRSDLNHDAKHNLVQQVEWLKRYPQMAVVVEGHADERGTREYNLALGERRAVAAKRFMAVNGVGEVMQGHGRNSNRHIRVVSFGKDKPVAQGADEMAFQKNRVAVTRVE